MGQLPVELRDQLSIDTPELVQLEFPLAGLGSRSLACIFDYFLQAAAFVLFVLAVVALGTWLGAGTTSSAPASKTPDPGGVWVAAIVFLIIFLVQWGYFTLFEAFWGGRTPGKRLFRLRVIEQSGRSITFIDALSRNLLRLVDGFPGLLYMVGAVFLFTTQRCQRLGDMVAGTVVVHEQKVAAPMWDGNGARTFTASMAESVSQEPPVRPSGLPADAIAKLSLEDVEMMENFDARRPDLPVEAGVALAAKMAEKMAQKMGVHAPEGVNPVDFLDGVAFERRSMGRR